jgi:hypothetical protein
MSENKIGENKIGSIFKDAVKKITKIQGVTQNGPVDLSKVIAADDEPASRITKEELARMEEIKEEAEKIQAPYMEKGCTDKPTEEEMERLKELQAEHTKIAEKDMYDDPDEMRDAGCRFGYVSDMEDDSEALTIHIKEDADMSIKDAIESDPTLWDTSELFDIIEYGNTFELRGETKLGSYRVHPMNKWPNMCQSVQYIFSVAEQTWYHKIMTGRSGWVKLERPITQVNNPDNFDLI